MTQQPPMSNAGLAPGLEYSRHPWEVGISALLTPAILFLTILVATAAQGDHKSCVAACQSTQKSCEKGVVATHEQQADGCNRQFSNVVKYQCGAFQSQDVQEYCIEGAVLMWKACHKTNDGNRDKAHKQCVKKFDDCIAKCDGDYPDQAGGSAGYRVGSCPNGTSPNPLGVCEAVFKVPGTRPGVGGCPPGQAPGPDDRCVPNLLKVKVAPVADGYIVACPDGMKPSPIDGGCVLSDVGPVEEELQPRHCPPGQEPSPDDGRCIPKIRKFAAEAEAKLEFLMAMIADSSISIQRPIPFEASILHGQLLRTRDPVSVLRSIEKSLAALSGLLLSRVLFIFSNSADLGPGDETRMLG